MPSNTFFGFQHNNSNVLCGLKTELTGNDPEMHEIIEVAITPFNVLLELHNTFPLFNMRMRPEVTNPHDDFKDCRLSRSEIADTCVRAFNKYKVADILLGWFEDMKLPRGKKIIPLTYNYPRERQIMIKWLGYENYCEIFSEDHRDILVAAHYINDRLACRGEAVPFAKQTLSWIAKQLNVVPVERGTATSDAFQFGEMYKRMLQMHD